MIARCVLLVSLGLLASSRIGAKRDQAYLARWLRDPSRHRPTAHMPKLQLTESGVQALAAYLGSLR